MSDRIDWIPIAAWSTWAAFQLGSAILDWMTKEEAVENVFDAFHKATAQLRRMQFEPTRGFRMWFKCEYCAYEFGGPGHIRHLVAQRPLPKNGNWSEWAKEEPMSVVMAIECRIPNVPDRTVILRRYSLLDSSIYVDIARVIGVINPEPQAWHLVCCDHLDDRTVVLVFYRYGPMRVFLVVIDIQQRSQYQIDIVASAPFHDVKQVCRREEKHGNRLRIVYSIFHQFHGGIINIIDYELTRCNNDPSRLVALEVSHQSIVFPHHSLLRMDRRIFFCLPGVHVLVRDDGASLALCFDDRGDFHGWPLDEWKRDLEETDFGQRLRNAGNDFRAILHEVHEDIGENYHLLNKYVLGTPYGLPFQMCFQRTLYVPSERRLAAEAVCRVNRSVDLSTFENESGIDIFDGIIRDQSKPVLTINLPRKFNPDEDASIIFDDD